MENISIDSSILDSDYIIDSSLLTEDGTQDIDLALWIDSINAN